MDMSTVPPVKGPLFTVDISETVRAAVVEAEFWRDIEATTRLYNPNEQSGFVTQLILRRARWETNESTTAGFNLTATEVMQMVQIREYELMQACRARGYLN